MRILSYDHAGHPFQVQLSRSLARRGHDVLHTYCAKLQTPRGALSLKHSDPDSFNIEGTFLKKDFNRYSLFARVQQEKGLGALLNKQVDRFDPEIVISSNTPLGTQSALLRKCHKGNIKFIFWVQDLLGVGIKNNVRKNFQYWVILLDGFICLLKDHC